MKKDGLKGAWAGRLSLGNNSFYAASQQIGIRKKRLFRRRFEDMQNPGEQILCAMVLWD